MGCFSPALDTHPLVPVQPAGPGLPTAGGPYLRQAEIAAVAGEGRKKEGKRGGKWRGKGGKRWLEGRAEVIVFSQWMGGYKGVMGLGVQREHDFREKEVEEALGGLQRGYSSRRGCQGATVLCGLQKGHGLAGEHGGKDNGS